MSYPLKHRFFYVTITPNYFMGNAMDNGIFDFSEKLNTPIIISDTEGTVIYKNRSARICIKLPACGANICERIRKDFLVPRYNSLKCRIEVIRNPEAIFRNALVVLTELDEDPCYIWIFPLSIQMLLPDDFDALSYETFKEIHRSTIEFLKMATNDPDVKSITRYSKLSAPMIKTINRLVEIRSNNMPDSFDVVKVIDSLRELTRDMARKYAFRVQFVRRPLDRNYQCMISYRNFAMAYSQLLMLVLKVTNYSPVKIMMDHNENIFVAIFSVKYDHTMSLPPFGKNLESFACAFPDEFENILIFEQFARSVNYRISYDISPDPDDKMLNIRLSMPTRYETKVRCPSIMPFLRMRMLQEEMAGYMEDIFNILFGDTEKS